MIHPSGLTKDSGPGVYRIVNIKNGRSYIGGTNNLFSRYYSHLRALRNQVHLNSHLQRSFNKYGPKNFKFEVLIYCTKEEVKDKEQKFLDQRWGQRRLYNICKDSRAPMRGKKFSKQHRKNLSLSIKKTCSSAKYRKAASKRTKNAYKNNPELRLKVSEGNRRAHADPKVKKKHSDAVKKSHARPETKVRLSAIRKGKHMTNEQKRRMRLSALRRWDRELGRVQS